jgi:N-succinyldiaminopimelate aminotransferase
VKITSAKPTNEVGDPKAARLAGLGTTIFTEMSALALETGAINLGQGFPDSDGPAEMADAVTQAMRDGHNQYAPLAGVPPLLAAIREHQRAHYGLEPEDVQVTFGATEAIASALLGLLDPGDEVVCFEPFYDSYIACMQFAGARRRVVSLKAPDWALDVDALRAAAPGAKLLLLNSPHNPTGKVFSRTELEAIAEVCREFGLIAVTDEVYEHVVFDGEHVPLATLMPERTLTISSAGKTFSYTGWKIGWASGPAELVGAVRSVKQFLTFAGGTPFQHAVAAALPHAAEWAPRLRGKRDLLCEGLARAGFEVFKPAGTYFVNVDCGEDGLEFCRRLPERAGVVAIPTGVFYDSGAGRRLVRFAFCKREEVIAEAASRLARAYAG